MLDKQTTDQGSQHATQRPSSQNNREIFWTLAEGYDISKNDLAHGDDAAAADALDGAPHEEHGEVLRDGRAQDRADGEGENGQQEHLLAPEDVGQRGDKRLAHGAGQEVRGTGPECVGRGAA